MTRTFQGTILPLLAAAAASAALSAPGANAGEGPAGKGFAQNPQLGGVGAQLDAAIASAEAEGLPSGMLEAKVKEGLVKKVEPAKILVVVEKLLGMCRTSLDLLEASGFDPTHHAIEGVARLLEMGMSETNAGKLLKGLKKAGADGAWLGKGITVAMMSVESASDGGEAVSLVLGILAKKGLAGLDSWIEEHSSQKPSPAGPGTKTKPKPKPPAAPKTKGKPHGK